MSSQRALIPGTCPAHPLSTLLPSLFLEDKFSVELCNGLDQVLAPVSVTLDCLAWYFDPRLTPPDFLDWLATWVGLSLDQNWPEELRRDLVRRASELYRWQGTVRGVVEHVKLYSGVEPKVREPGATTWSAQPGGDLPGQAGGYLEVQVSIGPGATVDDGRLDAVVAAAKPAHVPHRVIVNRAR